MEHSLGTELPLYSAIPFVCMLLSIAFGPILMPKFWHHYFGKISAGWAALIAIPLVIVYRGEGLYELLHVMIADYIPFIVLLGALFTVGGGILLRTTLKGTTFVNAGFLAVGSVLASWMGTTGAAMLLIRPFMRVNKHRKYRSFMVVFFIFTVANVGGALTPLGDPPLFLGFLHGVPFFWTLRLITPMLIVLIALLIMYIAFDKYYLRKEEKNNQVGYETVNTEKEKELSIDGDYAKPQFVVAQEGYEDNYPVNSDIRSIKSNQGCPCETTPSSGKVIEILGTNNFFLLAAIIGVIIFSGSVKMADISILGVHRGLQDIIRDILLVVILGISWKITPKAFREENEYSWAPIQEVAYLFFGIFTTMAPVLAILKAGDAGALGFITSAVKEPAHYFWVTGVLSGFLDNAPTYLTFFSTALGQFYPGMTEAPAVVNLLAEHPTHLLAISAGSVFFGALTYIGNAPNFMVRSIAEDCGVPMPSFFGYMAYSICLLLPIFGLITLLYF